MVQTTLNWSNVFFASVCTMVTNLTGWAKGVVQTYLT
jgi:hypothetical protein